MDGRQDQPRLTDARSVLQTDTSSSIDAHQDIRLTDARPCFMGYCLWVLANTDARVERLLLLGKALHIKLIIGISAHTSSETTA